MATCVHFKQAVPGSVDTVESAGWIHSYNSYNRETLSLTLWTVRSSHASVFGDSCGFLVSLETECWYRWDRWVT